MIVVDSSAIIAILRQEPEAQTLLDRLHAASPSSRLISAANFVEVGAVLAGRLQDPLQGSSLLDQVLTEAAITVAPLDEAQARLALEARIRFGKGFGAKANLNLGDSFAYALAKSLDAPLLYVGDDFRQTDVKSALDAFS